MNHMMSLWHLFLISNWGNWQLSKIKTTVIHNLSDSHVIFVGRPCTIFLRDWKKHLMHPSDNVVKSRQELFTLPLVFIHFMFFLVHWPSFKFPSLSCMSLIESSTFFVTKIKLIFVLKSGIEQVSNSQTLSGQGAWMGNKKDKWKTFCSFFYYLTFISQNLS